MPLPVNKQHRYSSQAIDLSVVPRDVFSVKSDAFYTLVRELTSEDVEDLLKIQRISTARSLLNTNPLTFFDLETDETLINELQNRLSYKMMDGKRLVLAGINADILYLKKLLKVYSVKGEKRRVNTATPTNDDRSSSPIQTRKTTSSCVLVVQSEVNRLSMNDHRQYLSQQIKTWWEKHRNDYDLENHSLKEPDDYVLIIDRNSAIIKYSCNRRITLPLPKERKCYQLSNFYKHLMRSDKCTVIKRKCDASETDGSGDDNNDPDPDSSSNSPSESSTHPPKKPLITASNQLSKRPGGASSVSHSNAKRYRQKW
jgi:hypothetical protein